MADTKITALAAITTVAPANDLLPIVDVDDHSMAASGTTKNITVNQILGAGGTATLASATITGDLTVDTSTLKVDSANNRVGVRTASPAATLSVVGSAGTGNTVAGITGNTDSGLLSIGNDNSNGLAGSQTWTGSAQSYAAAISFGQVNTTGVREQTRTHATLFSTNIQSFGRADLVIATKGSLDNNDPTEKYRIASDGVATWSNVGGVAGTAMTLNSTGLGVGMSPSASLSVLKSSATQATGLILRNANGADGSSISLDFETSAGTSGTEGSLAGRISGRRVGGGTTGALDFFVNNGGTLGTVKMTLDSSGNVGIGVAPSAGGSNYYKTLEIGKAGCGLFTATASLSGSELTYLSGNGVLAYNAGPEWKYGNNGAAAIYGIEDGVHKWYNATTGTAGVVFTPTQAMTLDESGRLFVGDTSITAGYSGNNYLIVGGVTSPTIKLQSTTGPAAWDIYSAGGLDLFIAYNSSDKGQFSRTTGTYTALSDANKKRDFEPSNIGLAEVLKLQPKLFRMIDDSDDAPKQLGFVAQDVQSVIPQAYSENDGQGGKFIGLQDRPIIAALTRAIQELAARVQTLETR